MPVRIVASRSDVVTGWDPTYRISIRVVCARAYHALFMRNMLVMQEDLPDAGA